MRRGPRRANVRPPGQGGISSMSVTASQKRKALGGGLYQKGDDRFLVIVRKNGEQRVKALVSRTKTDAKREAPGVIAELLSENGVAVGDRNVSIGALVDAFLKREEGPSR